MSYIEKEPIIEFITKGLNNPDKTEAFGYDAIEILTEIEYAPTADVVPKSEVEELKADLEVWKQNRFNIFQMLELYKMTEQEVASEIFAEIDRAVENAELEWGTICGVKLCIAELKKKYTEGE